MAIPPDRWEWIEMPRKWRLLSVVATVVVVIAGGVTALAGVYGGFDYTLKIVMPNAATLVKGSPVEIKGKKIGEITNLETRDDKALVTVSVSQDRAPLHAGTKAQVQWQSLIGERIVELLPGPNSNAALPSGAMIQSGTEQVELDQVLASLDPPTRQHLSSTVQQLDATVGGHKSDLNETLKTAGPAAGALGQVMQAVGQDGPAIRGLVTNLKNLTQTLGSRQQNLAQTVDHLTQTTDAVAPQQQQLGQSLSQLPGTLDTANKTLSNVTPAADQTVPLLNDLRPATSQLKSVSQTLAPTLGDLRPTLNDLKPTLDSANGLLKNTPRLLDSAHADLPTLNHTLGQVNPAVNFLRPYTPDLMGWLSNWSSAFSDYDSRGHVFHGIVNAGTNSVDDNPGIPAGLSGGPSSRPAPGGAMGHPWVDANGNGMR